MMALQVKFTWTDAYGRSKSQTHTTTEVTIAGALTEVTNYVALFTPVSDAGLTSVSISRKDIAAAYAATAGANIDVNGSLQTQGVDGFKYDLDLPMVKSTLVTGGGAIITTDVNLVAFTDQFLVGGKWRVNNRFPSAISSVISGSLDK
jgi:hypothetical protein